MESGAQASSLNARAARREVDWGNFVGGVASCVSNVKPGQTFDCLRKAKSSEILAGLTNAINKSPEQYAFDPTIDGPGGLYPDLPSRVFASRKFVKIPFISGTNLDEGKFFCGTPSDRSTSDLVNRHCFYIPNNQFRAANS